MKKMIVKVFAAACVCAMLSSAAIVYAAEKSADAYTTATQTYLTGKFSTFAAGEGIMANDDIKARIADMLGGRKHFNLYVLGTSYNNVPVTTNAEWTFDNQTMTFYGMHEKNTEKLIQIKANPDVSMSWNEGHFESFANYRGIQMNGKAEVISGDNPDFDSILVNFIPYESYQAMLGGIPLPAVRALLASMMEITKITMYRVTITNSDFKADSFRSYQRWTRGITLASFTAKPGNRSATIEWTTTKEGTDVTGFNIYRSEKGSAYEKINPTLIASKGAAGGSYSYNDTGLKNWHTYTYGLASVDNTTEETLYSTVSAQPRLKYIFTDK
jgi:hypothetical protein